MKLKPFTANPKETIAKNPNLMFADTTLEAKKEPAEDVSTFINDSALDKQPSQSP